MFVSVLLQHLLDLINSVKCRCGGGRECGGKFVNTVRIQELRVPIGMLRMLWQKSKHLTPCWRSHALLDISREEMSEITSCVYLIAGLTAEYLPFRN